MEISTHHHIHPKRLMNELYLPNGTLLHIARHTIPQLVPVHWHEFYEMALVIEGHGTHLFNGVLHTLERGSLFLLTPADFHELSPTAQGPLKTFNVIFSSNVLTTEVYQLLFQHLHHTQTLFSGEAFDALLADFSRLYTEVRTCPLAYQRVAYGIIERILIDLVRHHLAEQPPTPTEPQQEGYQQLRPALTYMQHHFREPLTLAQVAAQVHLSPNYFSERFREMHGTSFQRHLQELRLQFARSLLSASSLPITEICYAAGFNTLSHFERVFKQKYGTPPRSFAHKTEQI